MKRVIAIKALPFVINRVAVAYPKNLTQLGLEIMGGTDEKTDDVRILRHILSFIKNLGVDIKTCEMTIVDCQHYINRVDQYDFSEAVAADLKRQLNANTGVKKRNWKRFADNAPSNNGTALPPEDGTNCRTHGG